MTDYKVLKSNKLIQNKLTHFDTMQNKIMCVLISRFVNNVKDEFTDTTISVNELRKILGYKTDGGNAYKAIISAIDKLANNDTIGTLEYNESKGEFEYVWRHFFEEIKLTKDGCSFKWSDSMKPYLAQLSEKYTQYLQSDYLKLTSEKSQNLYEYLKSYENYENVYHKKPEITLEEHYKLFKLNKNDSRVNFKRLNDSILKKCINEINELTDIEVSYETKKEGRKVVAIIYDIKKKKIENNLIEPNYKIDPVLIYKIGFKGIPTEADLATINTLLTEYDYSAFLQVMKYAKFKKAKTMGYVVNACKNTISGITTSENSDEFIDPNKDYSLEARKFVDKWTDSNIDQYNYDELVATLSEAYKYFTEKEVMMAIRHLSANLTTMTRENIFEVLNNITELMKEVLQ